MPEDKTIMRMISGKREDIADCKLQIADIFTFRAVSSLSFHNPLLSSAGSGRNQSRDRPTFGWCPSRLYNMCKIHSNINTKILSPIPYLSNRPSGEKVLAAGRWDQPVDDRRRAAPRPARVWGLNRRPPPPP